MLDNHIQRHTSKKFEQSTQPKEEDHKVQTQSTKFQDCFNDLEDDDEEDAFFECIDNQKGIEILNGL